MAQSRYIIKYDYNFTSIASIVCLYIRCICIMCKTISIWNIVYQFLRNQMVCAKSEINKKRKREKISNQANDL